MKEIVSLAWLQRDPQVDTFHMEHTPHRRELRSILHKDLNFQVTVTKCQFRQSFRSVALTLHLEWMDFHVSDNPLDPVFIRARIINATQSEQDARTLFKTGYVPSAEWDEDASVIDMAFFLRPLRTGLFILSERPYSLL